MTDDLDRRAQRPVPDRRRASASTTRRCATASRPSASCSTREEKLEIARAARRARDRPDRGGLPARLRGRLATRSRLISEAGLRAEVWGFSRAVPADVEALVELGVAARVIESPISDLKLDALGVSRETMLERIATRCASPPSTASTPPSSASTRRAPTPTSTTRSTEAAVEAGAQEVAVVDTLGDRRARGGRRARRPHASSWLGPDVPVHFHGHNDFGLATAAAVAAVRAGARWVHGTINGMGERAGNANLGEVALTLRALYGVETNLRLDRPARSPSACASSPATSSSRGSRVVGENLFRRESGAVASQFHDPPSIEPYSSELVGAERGIVLGKKSGLDSIRIKAEELGLDVPEERRADLLARVKELGAESAASSPTTSSVSSPAA